MPTKQARMNEVSPVRLIVSIARWLILLLLVFAAGCSIPNLEPVECDQARDAVREFYSHHFGNDLVFDPQVIATRKHYLTPEFARRLEQGPPSVDPFTLTADKPKAFRAGECKVSDPGKRVSFEVLLFWKTDTRSEQRAIGVDLQHRDGRWLIDKVSE